MTATIANVVQLDALPAPASPTQDATKPIPLAVIALIGGNASGYDVVNTKKPRR